MAKQLPIVNTSRQSFSFNDSGAKHTVTLQWNTVAKCWFMDYARNDKVLLQGQRVVIGVNLIGRVSGNVMFVRNSSDNDFTITYNSLINGNTRLYFYTAAELAAA